MIKYIHILLVGMLLYASSSGCKHSNDDQILVLNNTDDTIIVALNPGYPSPIKDIFEGNSKVTPPHRVAVINGDWNKNYECQIVVASNSIPNTIILSQQVVTSIRSGWYSNIYLTYPDDFTSVDSDNVVLISGAFDGKTNL